MTDEFISLQGQPFYRKRWGEQDTALLPEATHDLERFAPGLTGANHPKACHWLCHEYPAEIANIILGWTATQDHVA